MDVDLPYSFRAMEYFANLSRQVRTISKYYKVYQSLYNSLKGDFEKLDLAGK